LSSGKNKVPKITEQLRDVIAIAQSLLPAHIALGLSGLYRTERAIHEYLGLLWAKLRGQIWEKSAIFLPRMNTNWITN